MNQPEGKIPGLESITLHRLLQIVKRIHPSMESSPRATFRPGGNISIAWDEWLATLWTPVLRPRLFTALQHARAGRFQEWQALDESLDALLPAAGSISSRSAGHFLLKTCGSLPGDRFFEKVLRLHAGGEKPHLLAVHAARCATFHLSDHWVQSGYFALELLPVCDNARSQDFFVELLTRQEPLEVGTSQPAAISLA